VLPFGHDDAAAFWRSLAEPVRRRDRAVLAVRDDAGRVVGTVQVGFPGMPNGRHRAEVAKLLVHPRGRRSGLGATLMTAAEQVALADGRHLLVLDTAEDDARRLYARLGYAEAGRIPDYARSVDGTVLDATTLMCSSDCPCRRADRRLSDAAR
jgi:ribosomal protein S18 acetylase RimI-like enzyme